MPEPHMSSSKHSDIDQLFGRNKCSVLPLSLLGWAASPEIRVASTLGVSNMGPLLGIHDSSSSQRRRFPPQSAFPHTLSLYHTHTTKELGTENNIRRVRWALGCPSIVGFAI